MEKSHLYLSLVTVRKNMFFMGKPNFCSKGVVVRIPGSKPGRFFSLGLFHLFLEAFPKAVLKGYLGHKKGNHYIFPIVSLLKRPFKKDGTL